MRVKLQLVICHDDGQEETVTDVITLPWSGSLLRAKLFQFFGCKRILPCTERSYPTLSLCLARFVCGLSYIHLKIFNRTVDIARQRFGKAPAVTPASIVRIKVDSPFTSLSHVSRMSTHTAIPTNSVEEAL